jgi:hypothetical protein
MSALKPLFAMAVILSMLLKGGEGLLKLAGDSLDRPLMEVPLKIVMLCLGGILIAAIILNTYLNHHSE